MRDDEGQYWELWEDSEDGLEWASLKRGLCKAFEEADLKKNVVYECRSRHDINRVISVLNETLDYGWIDRKGNFWGCDFTEHANLLRSLFNTHNGEVEKAGWVHLHPRSWFCNESLNEAQEKTLLEIGRDPLSQNYRNDEIGFNDVFPRGYPLGLLPQVKITRYRHKAGSVSAP